MLVSELQCKLVAISSQTFPFPLQFQGTGHLVPTQSSNWSTCRAGSEFTHCPRNPTSFVVLCRAVAADPVSPVSTGPLFPSPVACLVSRYQLAPLLGGHPHKARKHTGYMLKLARWLRTVGQNSSNNFPFF